MSTKPLIVMVHGGFHWGGCFEKVANQMAIRGFPVAMPDLAGHGYDDTPLSKIKTMSDYVAPVESILQNTSMPVVLLGHSMAGLTLNYLGERYSDKIARLIYLAAVMPKNGTSVFDNASATNSAVAPLSSPLEDGSGIRITTNPSALKAAFFGDCSDHDVEVAVNNLTEVNPMAPFVWVSDITPQRFGRVPRTYIETLRDCALPLEAQRSYQAEVPGATVMKLDSAHSPFLSHPGELTEILVSLFVEMVKSE